MRTLFSKLMTSSMIAGAALAVAGCHHEDNTANTADTNMTDMNTMDSSAGMTNDMSATDSMGNSGMTADNGAMAGNDAMSNGARAIEPDVIASSLACGQGPERPSGRPGGLFAYGFAEGRSVAGFGSARFSSTCARR